MEPHDVDPGGAIRQRPPLYLAKDETTFGFPPDRTALLIIDPVNDFLSEGGAGWDMTKTTVNMNDVIANLKRLIEGARARNLPVFFAPMAYTEEDYTDRQLQRRSGINRIMLERKMFLAGSWGADFHPELRPREDEIVLLPHKSIDVFETDLADHLERMGITHLVIAGMTANLCCESTGRHAMEHGYDVTFLSNAIGAENLPAYEASIHINYPLIANAVMEVDDFLAAVRLPGAMAEADGAVRIGDEVRGSDNSKIGTIERIDEGSESLEPHLVAAKGLIFQSDLYIPMEAVVRRTENIVFINVPKLVVTKMNWSEAPTRDERQARRGPAATGVRALYGSRCPSVKQHD